jgi:hypothetical protein
MVAPTIDTPSTDANARCGVVSVGYEGREVGEFIRDLAAER